MTETAESATDSTASQTVVIASANGLHARPAGLLTQAAAKSGLPVRLAKAGKEVNAASILGVISLGIVFGDEVMVSADGDNAAAVVAELVSILATDHDAA